MMMAMMMASGESWAQNRGQLTRTGRRGSGQQEMVVSQSGIQMRDGSQNAHNQRNDQHQGQNMDTNRNQGNSNSHGYGKGNSHDYGNSNSHGYSKGSNHGYGNSHDYSYNHDGKHHGNNYGMVMHGGRQMMHDGHGHYFAHDGFLPGWEGRVRYLDGRYGYLRDSEWYWYDTYFEPDYYYATPVRHFRRHLSPVGRKVAAGVTVGVVVGALVAALCR